MSIVEYIAKQPAQRQKLLQDIHEIIIATDKTILAAIELMMGKEMIVYKHSGVMKYALAGTKNYMSLHLMPIYCVTELYDKYKMLLPKANFQKGCINFCDVHEMPLDIVKQLIIDCTSFDLVKFREDYLKRKTTATKK